MNPLISYDGVLDIIITENKIFKVCDTYCCTACGVKGTTRWDTRGEILTICPICGSESVVVTTLVWKMKANPWWLFWKPNIEWNQIERSPVCIRQKRS